MSTSATARVSLDDVLPKRFWLTGDPDLDRSLANATAIIRRALPFTVYKPPGIVSTQNEYIYIHGIVIVATEKGLPPIDILRRMFMDKTDQQLLEMDKETVSLKTNKVFDLD